MAVVVAELVERSLPIPEVRESNPGIAKNYIEHLLATALKDENKAKEAGNGPFFKKVFSFHFR